MEELVISVNGVTKLLKEINPSKAGGPDNLPCRLLRELAVELAPILTYIYQQSLSTGQLPSVWKSAYVSPIFKKGPVCAAENYRPVSLTCIPCKILEHIICSHIRTHLDNHGALSPANHGFRKQHSCETQLLLTIQDTSFPERPPQVASGCRGVGFCKSIRQGSASPPDKQAKAVWTTWEHHSVDPCFPNSATATSHCRWSKVRRFRCPVGSPSGYSDGTTPIPTIHKWPALRRPSWNQRPLICGRLLSVSSHQDTRRPAPVPERSRCDVQMGPALGDEV